MTLKKFVAQGRTKITASAASAMLLALTTGAVHSATDTENMTVQLIVSASCEIQAANTLDFGTATTPLTANIDASTTIDVICTNGTTYDVGLGGGVAADVANRTMVAGGEDVGYSLSAISSGGANWGDTVGTDTVGATGDGMTQTYTVYGRVPPQTTPTANTYVDTVLVTVTY